MVTWAQRRCRQEATNRHTAHGQQPIPKGDILTVNLTGDRPGATPANMGSCVIRRHLQRADCAVSSSAVVGGGFQVP